MVSGGALGAQIGATPPVSEKRNRRADKRQSHPGRRRRANSSHKESDRRNALPACRARRARRSRSSIADREAVARIRRGGMCPRRRRTAPSCSSYFSGGRALASRRRRSRQTQQTRHHARLQARGRRRRHRAAHGPSRAPPKRHPSTTAPPPKDRKKKKRHPSTPPPPPPRVEQRRARARESGHGRRVRLHDGGARAVRRADPDARAARVESPVESHTKPHGCPNDASLVSAGRAEARVRAIAARDDFFPEKESHRPR